MQGRKGIAAIEIAAVVTKVVKQQQQTITELRQRVDQLEAALETK